MDACIFVLTINMAMPVYAADRATEISTLGINDKVCVMEIEPNDWMQIHWSNGNVGHTGFIRNTGISKPAIPTEPTPYESQEHLSPPPPTPAPPQRQGGEFAPNSHLVMICSPMNGAPYGVALTMGNTKEVEVISASGKTVRPYPIYDVNNNEHRHVLYVAAKRPDQDRTLFFAFDYSQKGDDVSAIRVKGPGYDSTDRCTMKGVM